MKQQLTAIIIDDETGGRMALWKKLNAFCPHVHIVGEAADGQEGLQLIEKYHPQIVFLDIQMPRMDGFEMLQQIDKKNFHLIFTTAYDQYAIKAIRYSAFDYLLKPVNITELQATIKKLESQTEQKHNTERLEMLQQNLAGHFHHYKIAIPTLEGMLFFNIADIVYLEADSNYSTVFFKDGTKLLTTRTLREFDEMLPSQIFFRPHQSFVINLNFIKRYIKGDGGQIEMQNGHMVDVARSKKAEFLKIIG